MNNINLNKYIKKRSIHHFGETHKNIKDKKFNFFIVIPCYNELNYIFETLKSINEQNQKLLNETLVIVVINNSKDEKETVKNNNQKTYQKLVEKKYNYNFIAIDAFSIDNAIPNKLAGVGYARKIGLDFSLNHISSEKSLLCSLDADTLINKNYLKKIKDNFKKDISVAVINFKHQKSQNPIIEEGIRKYEKSIKKIAKEIELTGSPYGYVSMGSTIVCNVKSYIACGGMNTKTATEDFYFLQALAKYTKIHKINELLVFPSSREENRVYLGTGFRMDEYLKNRLFKNLDFKKDSFLEIKKIIRIVKQYQNCEYNFIIKEMNKKLNKKSTKFLIDKDFKNVWSKFKKNSKNKNQFTLFFHQWFDALTIIKLLKKLNNF
jgi:glycosyltransferase involved in cell wall biosynthesis